MKDFFISYTKVDKSWAEWIGWVLEEAGYTVFIQAWDILPADNFVGKMQGAMTGTRKTIAVLSDDYFKSEYTEAEWTAAVTRDPAGQARLLVPIRVRPCEAIGFFATTVYIDIVGLSEQDARAAILGAFSSRLKPTKQPAYPGGEGEQRISEGHAAFPGVATPVANVIDKVISTSDTDDIIVAPLHQRSASAVKSALTAEEGRRLGRSLEKLSLLQFNILVFALNPPLGAIPTMPAPQNERVGALLRWAEGPGGRGLAEVQNLFREILTPSAESHAELPDAHRGPTVVKTCDRRKQEEEFKTFFDLCIQRRRGHAQVYVVHGRAREGHKSLVERFRDTRLRAHAGGAVPALWEWGWPQTGNLKVDGQWIVSRLFEKLEREDVPGSTRERARAFRECVASLQTPVVVVMHEIEVGEWLRTTRKLIRSYIEFWDEVKLASGEESFPLFVVFLNVVYPGLENSAARPMRDWRALRHWLKSKRVRLALRSLSRMRGRSPLESPAPQCASVALLKELPCVTLGDVKAWMRNHDYGEYEFEWEAHSQGLFVENRWDLFECKNMADIEWALANFVARMTPTERVYA
jgi:hypothetical protein